MTPLFNNCQIHGRKAQVMLIPELLLPYNHIKFLDLAPKGGEGILCMYFLKEKLSLLVWNKVS